MQRFVRDLEAAGCIYRNPNSRWSSPVYVAKRPNESFRVKIDRIWTWFYRNFLDQGFSRKSIPLKATGNFLLRKNRRNT
jgi:hypothetical protein